MRELMAGVGAEAPDFYPLLAKYPFAFARVVVTDVVLAPPAILPSRRAGGRGSARGARCVDDPLQSRADAVPLHLP